MHNSRAEYTLQNGCLFTEKNIFLFFKWPSLWHNTFCVNLPLLFLELLFTDNKRISTSKFNVVDRGNRAI